MPQKCSSGGARLVDISTEVFLLSQGIDSRIAGNLPPETPTMDRSPTLPRLRRSKRVNPTTPTFLSDLEAPPPTKPVVYSPVPTCTACQRFIQSAQSLQAVKAVLNSSPTFKRRGQLLGNVG
jgi:hypothetical protein